MPTSRLKNTLSLVATFAFVAACGDKSGADVAAPAAAEHAAEAATVEVMSSALPTEALIDPNTATDSELGIVPGLPAAAIQAIMAGRPFKTPGELDAAIGELLGDEGRKAVYALVFVKVGLNSGAEDDYKLIPSTMSPGKLAHEFEEYRPYESMEQFSREMSKYVSDEEVAYLERFVTLD
jgi:hypothetical protein